MRATAEQAGALFLIGKPFTAETFAEQLGAVLV
jgi:two-component system, chemotaxis family, chemotaxis protein CheY